MIFNATPGNVNKEEEETKHYLEAVRTSVIWLSGKGQYWNRSSSSEETRRKRTQKIKEMIEKVEILTDAKTGEMEKLLQVM